MSNSYLLIVILDIAQGKLDSAILIFLDAEKAFDVAQINFIKQVMHRYDSCLFIE